MYESDVEGASIHSLTSQPVDSVAARLATTHIRIIIVDDEETVRLTVQRILTRDGFEVHGLPDARTALRELETLAPDLIILDFVLPDMTGQQLCQVLRRHPTLGAVPILMLTGSPTSGLSTDCLNAGADDFLAKPFDMSELSARIRAILRRPRFYLADESEVGRGALKMSLSTRRVLLRGHAVEGLSPKEFEFLHALLSRSPQVVAKSDIARVVWGQPLEAIHPRTMDVHVRRLRIKIGDPEGRYLRTIPAVGYQWLG